MANQREAVIEPSQRGRKKASTPAEARLYNLETLWQEVWSGNTEATWKPQNASNKRKNFSKQIWTLQLFTLLKWSVFLAVIQTNWCTLRHRSASPNAFFGRFCPGWFLRRSGQHSSRGKLDLWKLVGYRCLSWCGSFEFLSSQSTISTGTSPKVVFFCDSESQTLLSKPRPLKAVASTVVLSVLSNFHRQTSKPH